MDQNSYSQQSTPSWFSGAAEPTPPNPPRIRKPFIIFIVVLIVIGGGVALVALINIASRPGCLSTNDYSELTGARYQGTLQPQNAFYTVPVTFTEASAMLDTPSNATVTTLAKFYKNHQSKSIQFTIDSSFSAIDTKARTVARTLALQQALTDAGIPTALIATNQPELIPDEESDIIDSSSFTVSITSLEGCR